MRWNCGIVNQRCKEKGSEVLTTTLRLAAGVLALLLMITCPARGELLQPLTAAQKENLAERDRLFAEANKLHAASKTADAIAAAEKALAIEREVFGPAHEEVAESLVILAGW